MMTPGHRVRVVALGLGAVAMGSFHDARAEDRKSCDAAYDQAQTFRDQKKLISAREQLLLCARPMCPASMAKDCVAWLAETERATPSVVLVAIDDANAVVASVKVAIDGGGQPRTLDGTSWDVDPGPHTFSFVSPDGAKRDVRVLVVEGEKDQRVTATFELTPAPIAAEVLAPPLPSSPPPSPPASFPARAVGFAVGGVGLAALAVGGVFGAMALSTKASDCPMETSCEPGTARKALGEGTVSTVGFVAGGVLAAGGLALVLFAPRKGDPAAARFDAMPTIGAGPGGLVLRARWW
jgi:hypothetical protein